MKARPGELGAAVAQLNVAKELTREGGPDFELALTLTALEGPINSEGPPRTRSAKTSGIRSCRISARFVYASSRRTQGRSTPGWPPPSRTRRGPPERRSSRYLVGCWLAENEPRVTVVEHDVLGVVAADAVDMHARRRPVHATIRQDLTAYHDEGISRRRPLAGRLKH